MPSDALITLPVAVAPVFARALVSVAESNVAIRGSHARIAASRRLLNPYFAVAGSSSNPSRSDSKRASSFAGAVRALLASGALFPIRDRWVVVNAGDGTGRSVCAVCHERIGPADIEYTVERGGRSDTTGVYEDGEVSCHFACFTVWREESLGVSREIA